MTQLALPLAAPAPAPAAPAASESLIAFGLAVRALIPARPGPRTPGAESLARMHAWADTQGRDYAAALGRADAGALLRIGDALVTRGMVRRDLVPTFEAANNARDDVWGAAWDGCAPGASREQKATAAREASAKHEAEALAALQRDLAPVLADALERWVMVRALCSTEAT